MPTEGRRPNRNDAKRVPPNHNVPDSLFFSETPYPFIHLSNRCLSCSCSVDISWEPYTDPSAIIGPRRCRPEEGVVATLDEAVLASLAREPARSRLPLWMVVASLAIST